MPSPLPPDPATDAGAAPTRTARAAGTGLRWRWALYDFATSAYATLIQTFIFAAYFSSQIAPDPVRGAAWWGYATAAAGLCIALAGPVLGAFADARGNHRRVLGVCTTVATLATAALYAAVPGAPALVVLAAVVVGTVATELAVVPYNAMLGHIAPPGQVGRWSGWGFALGYIGGLGCLVVALVGFVQPQFPHADGAAHVRATFVLAAVWMAVFALPLLRARGADVPGTGAPTTHALRTLAHTARSLPRYPGMLRFLVARMLYTDGVATVFTFGGVYAAGTFGMNTREVLMLGIVLNVSAGLGAFVLAPLDDRLGSRRTIVWSLWALLASGAVLLVVQSRWQFVAAAAVLGALVGPVQAASRSLMTHLSPAPMRGQLFGLYTFSGKATAFLGPALVGALTAASGNQRVGLSAVLVLLAVGLWLVRTVPDRRAPPDPAQPA